MWVIQPGDVLLQLPDDVPVPPGSVVAELPDGFADDPFAFAVRGGRVESRGHEELQRRRALREAARLTPDEVTRLRRVLEAGEL